jgi:hypothetical protein
MKVHPLPISVSDLLDRHIVESERLELKAGWNPAAIMRSVCAFANDFQNLGGGYILIGTEAKDGLPVLPPKGVPHGQIDRIQKELLQYCHLIQPNYFPILSIEKVSGRTVLVIWCPGGQNRPYKVPVDVCAKAKDYLIELPVHPAFKAPVEAPVKVPVKAPVKVPVKAPVKVPVIEGSSLNNNMERKILLLRKVRAVGRQVLGVVK